VEELRAVAGLPAAETAAEPETDVELQQLRLQPAYDALAAAAGGGTAAGPTAVAWQLQLKVGDIVEVNVASAALQLQPESPDLDAAPELEPDLTPLQCEVVLDPGGALDGFVLLGDDPAHVIPLNPLHGFSTTQVVRVGPSVLAACPGLCDSGWGACKLTRVNGEAVGSATQARSLLGAGPHPSVGIKKATLEFAPDGANTCARCPRGHRLTRQDDGSAPGWSCNGGDRSAHGVCLGAASSYCCISTNGVAMRREAVESSRISPQRGIEMGNIVSGEIVATIDVGGHVPQYLKVKAYKGVSPCYFPLRSPIDGGACFETATIGAAKDSSAPVTAAAVGAPAAGGADEPAAETVDYAVLQDVGTTSFSCETCHFELCQKCAEVPMPKPKPVVEHKEYCVFCGAHVKDGGVCQHPLALDDFAQPDRKTCHGLWGEATHEERAKVTAVRDKAGGGQGQRSGGFAFGGRARPQFASSTPDPAKLRYSILDARAEQIGDSDLKSGPISEPEFEPEFKLASAASEPVAEGAEPNAELASGRTPVVEMPAALWRQAVVQFVQTECRPGLINVAGAPVKFGSRVPKLYCGRHLGRSEIPGSDGTCGPDDGPQCADCIAYEPAPGDQRLREVTVTLDLSAEAKAFLSEHERDILRPSPPDGCGPACTENHGATVHCQRGHALEANARPRNSCDVCHARGTKYRCGSGCDYDMCESCFGGQTAKAEAKPASLCRVCEQPWEAHTDTIQPLGKVELEGSNEKAWLSKTGCPGTTKDMGAARVSDNAPTNAGYMINVGAQQAQQWSVEELALADRLKAHTPRPGHFCPLACSPDCAADCEHRRSLRVRGSFPVPSKATEERRAELRRWQGGSARLHRELHAHMAPRYTNIPHWTAKLDIGDEVELQILCKQAGQTVGTESKWVAATIRSHYPWIGTGRLLEVEVDPLVEMPTSRAMQRLANRGNPHHHRPSGFGEPSGEEAAKEILRPIVSDGASIVPPTSWNSATLASRGTAATVLINTDLTPLVTRAAACTAMIKQSPELLSAGRRILLTGGFGHREPRNAVVIGDATIEAKQEHIVMLQGKSVELMDLVQSPLMLLEPCTRPVEQLLGKLLAPAGTNLHECMTCMESQESQAFGTFCYAHYKVTGDSEEKRDPRHQHSICLGCLASYCEREIESGKNFVKCPMCPRSLQVREVRSLVPKPCFDALVARIKEMQSAHDVDDSAVNVPGLEIRKCLDCAALIEKNAGCDSMDCWRCGRKFRWQEAKLLGGAKPGVFGTKPGFAAGPGARPPLPLPLPPPPSLTPSLTPPLMPPPLTLPVGGAGPAAVGGLGLGPAAVAPTLVPPLPACPDLAGQPAAVGQWVDALGLAGGWMRSGTQAIRVSFEREQINFAALRSLTDETLRDRLQVTSWGYRTKLLKSIRALPAAAPVPSAASAAPIPLMSPKPLAIGVFGHAGCSKCCRRRRVFFFNYLVCTALTHVWLLAGAPPPAAAKAKPLKASGVGL
jgi:hypothetical protein